MTKLTSLIAATALVAITAGAARAETYQAQHLVRAVVSNQITEVFAHNDPSVRLGRASYLAAFSLWFDSRCDFLPEATFAQIRAMVDEASRAGSSDGTAEAAELGLQDAKTFLAEQGCSTQDARGARASLTRFWDGAMRAIGSERQANTAPPAGTEAPARRNRL
jgi:hypothetical protein